MDAEFIKIKEWLLQLKKSSGIPFEFSDDVDEVVLSYVSGVLEEPAADIDVEEFLDIMNAYLPGFSEIRSDDIKLWIHNIQTHSETSDEIANTLPETLDVVPEGEPVQSEETKSPPLDVRKKNKRQTKRSLSENESHASGSDAAVRWSEIASPSRTTPRSLSESSQGQSSWPELSRSVSSASESHQSEEGSRASSRTTSECQSETQTEQSELIEILLEMFPNMSVSNIEQGLTRTNNNLELTVVQLLEEETPDFKVISKRRPSEQEEKITDMEKQHSNSSSKRGSKKSRRKASRSGSQSKVQLDDEEMLSASELKSLIIDKYSFIPTDLDTKTYTPKLMTNDTKKMVRYRDGQVVSTRGERFSEVKDPMTEEMKKTYINLKPAKQYRFH